MDRKMHWEELIHDKSGATTSFDKDVDALLQKYNLPVWVTEEYKPRELEFNTVEKSTGLDRTYRLIVRTERFVPNQLLSELRALQHIESAEEGRVIKTTLPERSMAQSSARMNPFELMNLKTVHQLYTKGAPAIKIAVLDTGVNLTHPELKNQLLPGYDFVDIISGAGDFFGDKEGIDDDPEDDLVGHGTHVAGIIGAKGIKMSAGVVPNCSIIPVRVLGAVRQGKGYAGAGFVDHINAGIKWAVDNGADVINMSLGIEHEGGGLPHEDAIKYAQENGVTVVAASGNDGQPKLYYPGALPHVIAVGASRTKNTIAPFSTYGKVTVCAPGEQVYSGGINHGYSFASGTSQAAPFVAGSIALLKSYALQKGEELSDNQIKYLLKHTADRPTAQMHNQHWGYGHINLLDALRLLDFKLN